MWMVPFLGVDTVATTLALPISVCPWSVWVTVHTRPPMDVAVPAFANSARLRSPLSTWDRLKTANESSELKMDLIAAVSAATAEHHAPGETTHRSSVDTPVGALPLLQHM